MGHFADKTVYKEIVFLNKGLFFFIPIQFITSNNIGSKGATIFFLVVGGCFKYIFGSDIEQWYVGINNKDVAKV